MNPPVDSKGAGTAGWWNGHSDEERLMMALHDSEMRIRQIRTDQSKAKNAHAKFMRETNEQIKNCQRFIDKSAPRKANK